jgi:hypothetical protein
MHARTPSVASRIRRRRQLFDVIKIAQKINDDSYRAANRQQRPIDAHRWWPQAFYKPVVWHAALQNFECRKVQKTRRVVVYK